MTQGGRLPPVAREIDATSALDRCGPWPLSAARDRFSVPVNDYCISRLTNNAAFVCLGVGRHAMRFQRGDPADRRIAKSQG